ncbi:hypothetical protein DOZ80_25305 [Pseudomonas fluorescens]|uniref:Uncharacterized protein n=1 Tax=Pseudomonas fluorescens TaxID=294 RepID=A0A327MPH2_PSEFL|nr:hypothetical protein DOZ80_25305 [Pseudomonas fluorescens]
MRSDIQFATKDQIVVAAMQSVNLRSSAIRTLKPVSSGFSSLAGLQFRIQVAERELTFEGGCMDGRDVREDIANT